MNFARVQLEWARCLLSFLTELGCREFVVSPGSRSTPLALGLMLLGPDRVRIHSVIDERSAGFFALGLARGSARPPVLICTSGTAPAHYLPAVIEASESRWPLVVLTADRPLSLVGLRAPQTIDQHELYGKFAVASLDLGLPSHDRGGVASMLRRVADAVAAGREQGRPVHLNARFDKPLEMPWSEAQESTELRVQFDEHIRAAPRVILNEPSGARGVEALCQLLGRAKRPLFVLGELGVEDAARVVEFARRHSLPLLGECASQAAPALNVDWALRAELGGLRPDCVVQWGDNVCSGRWGQWLEATGAPLCIVGHPGLADPTGRAHCIVRAPVRALTALFDGELELAIESEYLMAFAALASRLERAVDRAHRQLLGSETPWSEVAAVVTLLRRLPEGTTLMVGNSLPLRLVNWLLGLARGGRPLRRVVVQRGVNGIDGLIAGALGLASAEESFSAESSSAESDERASQVSTAKHSDGPVVLLLGDVSTVHDLGSLSLVGLARRPIVVAVLDNGGGRIFDHLPIGRAGVPEYALFQTPPQVDFVSVARALGWRAHLASSDAALERILAESFAAGVARPDPLKRGPAAESDIARDGPREGAPDPEAAAFQPTLAARADFIRLAVSGLETAEFLRATGALGWVDSVGSAESRP